MHKNTARLDRLALPNLPTHNARARPAWAAATAVLYASTLRIESRYFDVGGFQFLVWLACVGGRYCTVHAVVGRRNNRGRRNNKIPFYYLTFHPCQGRAQHRYYVHIATPRGSFSNYGHGV
ncbi:hypothetical protein N656DRAFT_556485 [Canariomyces notabilis]|uniref:Uncharacterized protein n=1 Tax=Canariomyces notabilis TaxID=2074819 RepID=A0AAN6TI46_9PEZI|nr:hypothetical protein N656DRAFT_556485 [Canariomyces arenarius]